MKLIPRPLYAVVVLGPWLAAGCFTVDPVNTGTGGTAGTGAASGTGGESALCEAALATLAETCGVTMTGTYAADCEAASATYKSCLSGAGSDCNNLAKCWLENNAPMTCPDGGGVPSGDKTCAQATVCVAACLANDPSATCICGCQGDALSTVARYLAASDSCSEINCANSCDTSPPSDCGSCVDTYCMAQEKACMEH